MKLENYLGREQSYIKHHFLTQYLQAAAYKILQGRSPTFNFVDAFAGPWQVSDENYSDASFDQALRTLEAVHNSLGKNGISGLKIKFCFCERRKDAFVHLCKYAKQQGKFEIYVFHGSFEDQLDKIAAICDNGFTFTFIDPTGWNIRSEPILEFLCARHGEFLLNFMAEHVNRHARYSQVAASFGRFLADPDWATDFNSLPSNWSNEHRVLHLLKSKLKETGAAIYLPDFPILKPLENRVKMRLVLGTRSSKGLEVFRDIQGKVERLEIEAHDQLRIMDNYQTSLFTDDEIVAMKQDSAGIGCSMYQHKSEQRIIELLSGESEITFSTVSTDILENVPMRLTQIKKLANKMKQQGTISFELPPGKRVPQPETRISLAN